MQIHLHLISLYAYQIKIGVKFPAWFGIVHSALLVRAAPFVYATVHYTTECYNDF